MFGSPVGGISRQEFRRHLLRIGIAIADSDIIRLFNYLDADGNNAVDFQEMVNLLMPKDYEYDVWAVEAAYRNDTAYIQKAMRLPDPELEPERDVKEVDLRQLTNLMYRKIVERTKCPQDQYREAYQMFGSPNDGIRFPEFKMHLSRLGIIVSNRDAMRLFRLFDHDNNGAIDFKEMVSTVMPKDYGYDCWGIERSIKGEVAYLQHAMREPDAMGKGIQQRLKETQMARLRNKPVPKYASLKQALEKTRSDLGVSSADMNRRVKYGLDRRGWAPVGAGPDAEAAMYITGPEAAPYGDHTTGYAGPASHQQQQQQVDMPLVTGRRPPTRSGQRPSSAAPRRTARGSRGSHARPQSAVAGRRPRHAAGGGLAAARAAAAGSGGGAGGRAEYVRRQHGARSTGGEAHWRVARATGGTSNARVLAAQRRDREAKEVRIRATLKRQRARQRRRMAASSGLPPSQARRVIQSRVVAAIPEARASGAQQSGGGGWQRRAWAGGRRGGYITARGGTAFHADTGVAMAGRWIGGR